MAPRTIYLVSCRNAAHQRAHFSIFVPYAADPEVGTRIHAVGAPMAGYTLEFNRNYSPAASNQPQQTWAIGEVDSQHIVESTRTERTNDSKPQGDIEKAASQCPTPGISENFMAPVNQVSECISAVWHGGLLVKPTQTTNRRCQEWTIEFVNRLVQLGYIEQNAVNIVQSHRDPPNHGIGLRPVGQVRGSAAPDPAPGPAQAAEMLPKGRRSYDIGRRAGSNRGRGGFRGGRTL